MRSHPSHPLKLSTPPALLRESNRPAHLRGSCDDGTTSTTEDSVAVVLCTTTITMEYRRGLGDTDGLFGVGFDSCDDPLVGRVPDIVIFFFFGTDVGANRREEQREGRPDRTYGRERTQLFQTTELRYFECRTTIANRHRPSVCTLQTNSIVV